MLALCKSRALVSHLKGTDVGSEEGILASTSTGIVSDASWKCTTMLEDDWTRCFFDDSHWHNARQARGPSRRPSDISSSASWIWAEGSDGGTVYCRKRIKGSATIAILFSSLNPITQHYIVDTDLVVIYTFMFDEAHLQWQARTGHQWSLLLLRPTRCFSPRRHLRYKSSFHCQR